MAKPPQIEVRVPRVFCGPDGRFGNPLGVVLDGPSVPVDDRQALATHLGYSETVFVDDAAAGRIVIFTPVLECRSPATRPSGPPGCWPARVTRSTCCDRRQERCRSGATAS